ncbi:MAG: 4Fe-4S binding protein [Planctomycetota bacterium]|nr:4Fe-4S binding protein [Planctomycetota bacterium]
MAHLTFDGVLCSGCRTCELVCAVVNRQANNPKKGAIRIKPLFPQPRFEARLCTQCGKCAEVCPVEAIEENDGKYLINYEECTGCFTCVEECPSEAMFTHPALKYPFKCILCGECVRLCPRLALAIQS